MLATRTAAVAAASPRREEGRAYVDLQAGIYFIDWRAASAPPTSGNLLPHSPAVSSPICVPAFAREASEGCHAEAHRAKAGCAVRELRLGKPSLRRWLRVALGQERLWRLARSGLAHKGAMSLVIRNTRRSC